MSNYTIHTNALGHDLETLNKVDFGPNALAAKLTNEGATVNRIIQRDGNKQVHYKLNGIYFVSTFIED